MKMNFTKEIMPIIIKMVMESYLILMVISTLVNGKMVSSMAKENASFQAVQKEKEHLKTTKKMGSALKHPKMEKR